jgi:dolichol kinase
VGFVPKITDVCRLISYFNVWGFMSIDVPHVAPTLLAIAAASTAVESLPATRLDDNWSVPATAAALSHALGFTLRAVALPL